jgi:hypothetical protein
MQKGLPCNTEPVHVTTNSVENMQGNADDDDDRVSFWPRTAMTYDMTTEYDNRNSCNRL